LILKKKKYSSTSHYDDILLLYKELREEKSKKWNRVLPFNELLVDRWEKAKYLKAKTGTSIYDNSYVYGDVSIGKSTWIGPYTILDGSGAKLSIGDFCSISAGVQIYTHNTVNWALTGGQSKYESNRVKIGSCCYIGPNSIVSMGSSIGSHSIIGAQSMINGKVPSNSVVFGTPGKIVGNVKIVNKHFVIQYFDKPKNLKRF
jgi:carbonic anhydrase/acetyltransferase-like protein (isoleucine patch superfamily)